MVSSVERRDCRGTAWQGGDCARRTAAVLRRASTSYASEARPRKLLVPPIVIVAITCAAWYATIFHYQSWGWIVTGCLTVLACLSVDHVLRWERHRQKMLRVVTNPKVWWVDCILLVVGALFVALAFWVY